MYDTPAGGPYGERLVPNVIDDLAKSDPERVYAMTPLTADVTEGFRPITMRELANAVNKVAWWIHNNFGSSQNFETITYMGATDIRYGIFFFAAIKCGYMFLVPSSRNSLSGNISLLTETKCTKAIVTSDMAKKIPDLEKNIAGLQSIISAPLDDLLVGISEPYPYNRTYAQGWKDPVLICHTSGSTGAPKPITLRNGYFSVYDNHRKLSKLPGRENMDYTLWDLDGGRFVNAFPGFHVGGISAVTVFSILYHSTIVMVPSEKPANGVTLGKIISQIPIAAIHAPPTVLEELLETPDGLDQLSRMKFVQYGGGPLSPAAGDRITQVTKLTSAIGSTELGILPARQPKKENWQYWEWHPDIHVEMKHVVDDIHELILPNKEELKWIRGLYHTFPEVPVWHTNDHYQRHPTEPNLWAYRGRGDDVIVLSNGEKFQPVTTEGIVAGHPDVAGALVAGTGRFQPVLIVEPREYGTDPEAFVASIWPTVQEANAVAAAHGRIFRGKVIVATPEKPFLRTGKQTIMRIKSTALYADEIEAAFSDEPADMELEVLSLEQVHDPAALKSSLRAYIASVLPGLPEGLNGDKEDFFACGLDSVQTIELASGLRALLRPHLDSTSLSSITAKAIYANSTVNSLSDYISNLLGAETDSGGTDRIARMKALVDKYTRDLPNNILDTNGLPLSNGGAYMNLISRPHGASEQRALRVAITGTTGSMGGQLLQAFLNDPKVAKVYCLNRSKDAMERHEKTFAQRHIAARLSKAEFFQADFADTSLGLSPDIWNRLTSEVDIIIHNAWKVNFNQTVDSFEDQIRGVRNFIDWSLRSQQHPRLMFVSSASSVGNWSASYPQDRIVPETSLAEVDYNVSLTMGYGESKHVSERILGIAAARSGVKVNILRPGQIAGPTTSNGGAWNRSEWFPSLAQTSKSLGCIPDSVMDVDWIPVNDLAQIIFELAHQDHEGIRVYNLVNPHNRAWKSITPVLQEQLGGRVVSLTEWIEELRKIDVEDKSETAAKPAVKILDFFAAAGGEQLRWATGNGTAASRTMAELPPVSDKWVRHWLEQLDF